MKINHVTDSVYLPKCPHCGAGLPSIDMRLVGVANVHRIYTCPSCHCVLGFADGAA